MKKVEKLELGKKSIANLSKPEMKDVKGGATMRHICTAMSLTVKCDEHTVLQQN